MINLPESERPGRVNNKNKVKVKVDFEVKWKKKVPGILFSIYH